MSNNSENLDFGLQLEQQIAAEHQRLRHIQAVAYEVTIAPVRDAKQEQDEAKRRLEVLALHNLYDQCEFVIENDARQAAGVLKNHNIKPDFNLNVLRGESLLRKKPITQKFGSGWVLDSIVIEHGGESAGNYDEWSLSSSYQPSTSEGHILHENGELWEWEGTENIHDKLRWNNQPNEAIFKANKTRYIGYRDYYYQPSNSRTRDPVRREIDPEILGVQIEEQPIVKYWRTKLSDFVLLKTIGTSGLYYTRNNFDLP